LVSIQSAGPRFYLYRQEKTGLKKGGKMTLNSLSLIYFSPTGGTQKVLEAIARGMQLGKVEQVNITSPEVDNLPSIEIHADLAVIGLPVYAGRVPLIALERMQRLRGLETPALIVVVYGNREFEDALLELKNLAIDRGFRPLGAAAFIAEHSYSTAETPLAPGRPDPDDLDKARSFGRQAFEKLGRVERGSSPLIEVPGIFPHKERVGRPAEAPGTREELCTLCGTCALVCPTAAIVVNESVETRAEACILCQACVKNCPTGARAMEGERVRKVTEWLYANCKQRKEPEIFL
jgi:ferredoxin